MKIACLHDFVRKNKFLPTTFYTQNDNFSISEGEMMKS